MARLPESSPLPNTSEIPLVHEWIKRGETIAFVWPETDDPLLEKLYPILLEQFEEEGEEVVFPERAPGNNEYLPDETQAIVTGTIFNQVVPGKEALLFHSKSIYAGLNHHPKVFNFTSIDRREFGATLGLLAELQTATHPKPKDFPFQGLNPFDPEEGLRQLQNQTREGGPLLGLGRLIESQVKCFDVVTVIGDRNTGEIDFLIRFDLAGGRPEIRVKNGNLKLALKELVLRLMTFLSTKEANKHLWPGTIFTQEAGKEILEKSGKPLIEAGKELGEFGFFNEPVDVKALTGMRHLGSQMYEYYSAGCLACLNQEYDIWVISATGTRDDKPIPKYSLHEEDLALAAPIVKKDLSGVYIAGIDGREVKPSSEGVEIVEMGRLGGFTAAAHGHVMVESFDPRKVKSLFLEDIYHDYSVSCATIQLVKATTEPVRRQASDSDFKKFHLHLIVQPCHGIWLLERPVAGKKPFELMLEYLEKGIITLASEKIPQGPFSWEEKSGRCFLRL